ASPNERLESWFLPSSSRCVWLPMRPNCDQQRGGVMHAHSRSWAAWYGPRTIRAMMTAFDEAWELVQLGVDTDTGPQSFEAVRLRLADAILAEAAHGNRSVATLRNAGLLAMAMQYRLWPDSFPKRSIMLERAKNSTYWRSYAEETRTIADQTKD